MHGTRALTLTTHTVGNARQTSRHHKRSATNSCDSESLPKESRGKGHKNPYRRTKNQTHEGPSRCHDRLLLAPHDVPPLRTSRRHSAKPEPPEEERGNFSSSGRRRKEKSQNRGKGHRPRLLASGPQNATGRGVAITSLSRRPPRLRPERAQPGCRDSLTGLSDPPATLTGGRRLLEDQKQNPVATC
ncbi:hypothetical protein Taro_015682 [Colocasia esculenta]|uniref:Uncharacterized protein n=1 Tax=Colocasia esculenta TaxID=4460 RepID=A0A843UIH1_COLES|nr:hypothetical protein [Colocasia esculenta]